MKKQKVTMLISKSKKRGYKPSVMISLDKESALSEVTDKQFKRIRKNSLVKDIYARVGENVRALRIKQSLSVKQLAAKSGVIPSFLSNIENGKRKATLYTMDKLARGLGVEMRDLIGLEIKDDGLTDKEFINKVLLKRGKLVYTKVKKVKPEK